MQMIQTQLARGNTFTVCWLPVHPKVHLGSVISFVRGGKKWKVIAQWAQWDSAMIKHDWNNNI